MKNNEEVILHYVKCSYQLILNKISKNGPT